MSVTSTFPVPVPTPYQSPKYGGSIFAPVGQQGPYMSPRQQYSQPIGPGMGTYGAQDVYSSSRGKVAGTTAPTPPSSGGGGGNSGANQLDQLVNTMVSKGYDPTSARAVAAANFDNLWNEYMGGGSGSNGPDFDAGYNDYVGQLDQVLNNLSGQRTSQEQIAQNQYKQGVNALDLSKTQGLQAFEKQRAEAQENQTKTLRDLSSNLRNSFMAGNIYLGARGAGDSSAANQYSYALTKLGNQQRGDIMTQTSQIMNDIDERETNLNNVYDAEIKNLQTQLDTNIQSITQWFNEQQNNLSLQKGQAAKERSQQVLNYALSQLQTAQQEAANKKSALEQWAMNNATTINQLKQNLSAIPSSGYTLPTNTPLVGQPVTDAGGNTRQTAYGGGYVSPEEKEKQAAQKIWNIGSGNWWR